MSLSTYYFIVKEIDLADDCKHKRYFKFPVTGRREITSLNYFFWGTKRRNFKPSYFKGTLFYYCQREHEFNEDQERHKKQNLHWKGEPIEVDSIWTFYKTIGYDYKKQKWLKIMPETPKYVFVLEERDYGGTFSSHLIPEKATFSEEVAKEWVKKSPIQRDYKKVELI